MFFEACTCLQVGGMGGRVDSRERKPEVKGDGKSNQEEISEGIGLGRWKITNSETEVTGKKDICVSEDIMTCIGAGEMIWVSISS